MSTPLYLKITDVQQRLGKCQSSVEKYSKFVSPDKPFLKSYLILGRRRWLESDVDAFIAANTKPSLGAKKD
jgi:hypothetical protein